MTWGIVLIEGGDHFAAVLDNDLYQLSFALLAVLLKRSFGTLSCCLEAPYNDKLQTFENGIGHGSAATNILWCRRMLFLRILDQRGNAVD